MSGIDFLADTNILIYLLEGKPALKFLESSSIAVSVISEIELLGNYKISKNESTLIRGLLNESFIIGLIPAIKEIAIELKQKNKIRLPDAIIAATSIYLDVPLISADKRLCALKEINSLLIEI